MGTRAETSRKEKAILKECEQDFLKDLYNAFSYVKNINPNCEIGDIHLNF